MKRALKKLVIAHSYNQYKPHLLRETGLIALGVLAIVLFTATEPLGVWVSETRMGAAIYPAVLTDFANESRMSNKIGSLTINPTLEKAALLKAQDMATKGYFAHNSPEGTTPWHWFTEAGYSYVYAGENLAIDFSESRDIQSAWMNSPGHRANILNPHYTEIGIATYPGMYQGKPTVFVVELFASPKPNSILGSQPAAVAAVDAPIRYSSWYQKLLINPSMAALVVACVVILMIIIALGSMALSEIKVRNKKHIAYGLIILCIMAAFIYVEWHAVLTTIKIA